jgi:glycerol kinase
MSIYTLSIDQGTTSTRSIIFDKNFQIISTSSLEFKQIFPKDGYVEHNPKEIFETVIKTARTAIARAKISVKNIVGIGITNQRETTLLWNKKTGNPIYNAIVWQDRRTDGYCKNLTKKGLTKKIQKITGLVIDSYFSATKIKWILDNIDSAQKLLKENKLLFGTIDTWILWNLTEGRSHLTEPTNASRTMLFDIKKNAWSEELLKLFNIPKKILPEVKDSADQFGYTSLLGGKIPIGGIAGDQQAALIGQACFETGSIKSTYGTGCFMLMNTGTKFKISKNNLLTTTAYRLNGQTSYALEGSIFIAGAAVQWLRDSLKMLKSAEETESLYTQNDKSTQIYLVPAFVGLGAPYWDGEARGAIFGMTRNTGIADFVKATIDSIAYQTKDLIVAMEKDSGIKISNIKVDGGMVRNEQFLQFLSNILISKCDRPKIIETTALGAAYLSGITSGLLKDLTEISKKWQSDKVFQPKISKKEVKYLYQGWLKAVSKTIVKRNTKK